MTILRREAAPTFSASASRPAFAFVSETLTPPRPAHKDALDSVGTWPTTALQNERDNYVIYASIFLQFP